MQSERNQRDSDQVTAAARENLWAGLGAAVLMLSGQGAWYAFVTAPPAEPNLLLPLLAGGATFGALSLLRFSLDEWRDSLERAKMLALLTDKQLEIDRLQAGAADLRSENQRLNATLRGHEFKAASAGARAVAAEETGDERILRNAERILTTWQDNLPYGRDACKSMGLSRPEWEAAIALMQTCNVVGRGGPGQKQWIVIAANYSQALVAVRQRTALRTQTANTSFVAA